MIKLYLWDSCPFCKKVVRALHELGLKEDADYKIIDASPGTTGRAEVLKAGGKAMVPFMVDGAVSMYESSDIIVYLQNKTQAS